MAVSGDVTIAQDGGPGNAKLHPYLVALVRWCVSCLWSTATVLLHRLMTTPLPPIAASKSSKPRPAGKEHLDPEPRVECVVLHEPAVHGLDVIFVHGLYGSLGNTWRQGEWKSKYESDPEKVHLRRPKSIPTPNICYHCDTDSQTSCLYDNDITKNMFDNKDGINKNNTFDNYVNIDNNYDNNSDKFYKNIKKILPNDDVFITEKFFNNTLLDQVQIVDNYETQAQFVSDLFKACDKCDENTFNNDEGFNNGNGSNGNGGNNDNGCAVNCRCKVEEVKECEIGCGCTCDECYSPCWPRDWIKVDYPEARVISINYTSDPHLWRPLWIKENKRLRLHERADQMTQQLLDLGVGERPVIWVGHSKGGLFIKQIYCEAYEAYLKTKGDLNEQTEEQNMTEFNNDNEINNRKDINNILSTEYNNDAVNVINNDNNLNNNSENTDNIVEDNNNVGVAAKENESGLELSSNSTEDSKFELERRAGLWLNSVGFMFYSVPHRGSPLADIKTPVTARSVELLEISKDCSLVLSLQDRWLRATALSKPLVRSLVETRRTLMSVLWLRIVSTDSADPGIGALCGVSVDHREICKPSSRQCLLYTELAALIRASLTRCRCQ